MARGNVFVVSAPSGAGKTSLIDALCKTETGVRVSVSHTTRASRPGEVDGVNYHFVGDDTFNAMKAAGVFLETAHVFHHQYGTSRDWVEATLAAGEDVLLEIDWQGGLQIYAQWPEAVLIFILPPSMQALKNRLEARAQDSHETIAVRLKGAVEEIRHYTEYHYLVINDDFKEAVAALASIVVAKRLRVPNQQIKFRGLIDELLK